MTAVPKVVVVGGGFGGLETAFMLRMRMGDSVDISLVSNHDKFLFKPNTIYIPFGAAPESLLIDLHHPLKKRHITFYGSAIKEVDPRAKRVSLADGSVIRYDKLVLATGAAMREEEVPGLGENASTIFSPHKMVELGRRLASLKEKALAGEDQKVLFLVPPNNKCSGPLYEIVFMLETWARRQKIRDRLEIAYSTYEKGFIQAFGPRLHEVVSTEFSEREIEGHNEELVESVEESTVRYQDGSTREFDQLISFPPYIAAVDYASLPRDERGFKPDEFPALSHSPQTHKAAHNPNHNVGA